MTDRETIEAIIKRAGLKTHVETSTPDWLEVTGKDQIDGGVILVFDAAGNLVNVSGWDED